MAVTVFFFARVWLSTSSTSPSAIAAKTVAAQVRKSFGRKWLTGDSLQIVIDVFRCNPDLFTGWILIFEQPGQRVGLKLPRCAFYRSCREIETGRLVPLSSHAGCPVFRDAVRGRQNTTALSILSGFFLSAEEQNVKYTFVTLRYAADETSSRKAILGRVFAPERRIHRHSPAG
jgi:hypothetical protein